jgi:hypothetical protein
MGNRPPTDWDRRKLLRELPAVCGRLFHWLDFADIDALAVFDFDYAHGHVRVVVVIQGEET